MIAEHNITKHENNIDKNSNERIGSYHYFILKRHTVYNLRQLTRIFVTLDLFVDYLRNYVFFFFDKITPPHLVIPTRPIIFTRKLIPVIGKQIRSI